MAVDTPAKIVVIGAGPIGLETALYARFLGYDVDLLERGRVAESMRQWGHVRLFSPFRMNVSQLGRAALRAQDTDHALPGDDQLLTGRELVGSYYVPLSETDLLADGLRTGVEVLAIGREALLKGDQIAQASRGEHPFRLLVRTVGGRESIQSADVVIDCSGTYGHPNWLGQGGIPALGEIGAGDLIDYALPDVRAEDRPRFSGRHTLLVGGGYSAATTAVQLAKLATEAPGTRVTWVTRRDGEPPLRRFADDPLPQRDALAAMANRLAAEQGSICHLPATAIGAIRRNSPASAASRDHGARWAPDGAHLAPVAEAAGAETLEIDLLGRHAGRIEVDRIVAHTGYRPDLEIARELQVHTCYATEGPVRLAAHLIGQAADDCLQTSGGGTDTLMLPEPNYYILGAKSYGRRSDFLIRTGLAQIRDLFARIMDSPRLDLYTSIQA